MRSRTLVLTEYRPLRLARESLDHETGTLLWRQYDAERGVLRLTFPSPRTGQEWEVTSQGWVGHIPLTPQLSLNLQPRVPLGNLFGMLEVAYRLQSFHILEGVTSSDTLLDVYERLALELAQRVLARARQGFYQAYVERQEPLPYLRGRLLLRQPGGRAGDTLITCRYEEATTDVAENQILAWTLRQIARSALCSPRVQPVIRRACRSLKGVALATPFTPEQCARRFYNRLNDDYRPLHALCRFFLEQSGPGHRLGERTMLPFLVNMARLYEQFVAEWLRTRLPAPWSLRLQEQVEVGEQPGPLNFYVDLVLYDGEGRARAVLDTKYKSVERPSPADVAQIVAYAHSKGCREAILVYPQPLRTPFSGQIGEVQVRTLSFSLDGDLQARGSDFLQQLAARWEWPAPTAP